LVDQLKAKETMSRTDIGTQGMALMHPTKNASKDEEVESFSKVFWQRLVMASGLHHKKTPAHQLKNAIGI
jgi:hypothetical protein